MERRRKPQPYNEQDRNEKWPSKRTLEGLGRVIGHIMGSDKPTTVNLHIVDRGKSEAQAAQVQDIVSQLQLWEDFDEAS